MFDRPIVCSLHSPIGENPRIARYRSVGFGSSVAGLVWSATPIVRLRRFGHIGPTCSPIENPQSTIPNLQSTSTILCMSHFQRLETSSGADGHYTATMPTVLSIDGARKRYGQTQALDGAAMALHQGEWLALLGPNGAGKTTLIRAIAGRVKLDAGEMT